MQITKEKKSIKYLKKLTRFTVPAGLEKVIYDTIQSLCNKKLHIDEYGNMYIKIGNWYENKLLFTAHLDTYSSEIETINSKIENGFLKTDEKTILGGDNKTGCAMLINMINNNISGTYYFFVEEEVGRKGSIWFNNQIKDGEYTFAVAFDRKETCSLVTHQRGIKLINDELTKVLLDEFSSKEYEFKVDHFGFSCDTVSLIDKVNNCLNISNGTYDEHKKTERVDLEYYDYMFNKVIEIDWEKISKNSNIKERGDTDFSKLINNQEILNIVNYFLSKGYRPNKIPKFDEEFAFYTKELYLNESPRIFNYHTIKIKENGKLEYFNEEANKEDVYKNMKNLCKIKSTYFEHGGGIVRIVSLGYENELTLPFDEENRLSVILYLEKEDKYLKFFLGKHLTGVAGLPMGNVQYKLCDYDLHGQDLNDHLDKEKKPLIKKTIKELEKYKELFDIHSLKKWDYDNQKAIDLQSYNEVSEESIEEPITEIYKDEIKQHHQNKTIESSESPFRNGKLIYKSNKNNLGMRILEGFTDYFKTLKSINFHVNKIIKQYQHQKEFIYHGIRDEYIKEVGVREVGDEDECLIKSLQIKAESIVLELEKLGYGNAYRIEDKEYYKKPWLAYTQRRYQTQYGLSIYLYQKAYPN